MKNVSVVRADFYEDGTIIPLSITIGRTETKYINKVINIGSIDNGAGKSFVCEIDREKKILIYMNGNWTIE